MKSFQYTDWQRFGIFCVMERLQAAGGKRDDVILCIFIREIIDTTIS